MGHRTLQLNNHNSNCASDLLPEIKNECVCVRVCVRTYACSHACVHVWEPSTAAVSLLVIVGRGNITRVTQITNYFIMQ